MRTTLDFPDALLRQLKSRAALQGTTLKQLVRTLVERGLAEAAPSAARGTGRSRLPSIRAGQPLALDQPSNARLFQALDEVEAAEPPPPWDWTGRPTGDLPDVNVWLALAVQEHPHHAAAAAYWKREPASRLWFNRVTMLALVRLLCQPKVMGSAALDPVRAHGIYRRFAALPEVGFAAEPDGCDAELQRLLPALPARLLTDAWLAAFATATGLRLVTFDADFDRFDRLHRLRLSA